MQPQPPASGSSILYERQYHNESEPTSGAKLFFYRTAVDGGICEFVLTGTLSDISAAVLFPEDVTIIHSAVDYRYQDNGIWYEKIGREPPRVLEVLDDELAPSRIPGHILPLGFDSGYRFLRKLFKRKLDEPRLNDYLENEFDPVAVAFIERSRVETFCIRIPIENLSPARLYDIKIVAEYYDGQPRHLCDDAYLLLE